MDEAKLNDPDRVRIIAIENDDGHPEILRVVLLDEGIRVYDIKREEFVTIPFDAVQWHHRP